MEAIKNTTRRIHPLMAGAAASVIIVSLAGTAAITGILPSSNSAPQAQPLMNAQQGTAYMGTLAPAAQNMPTNGNALAQAQQVQAAYAPAAQGAYQQPVQGVYAQPASAMYAQPAPVVAQAQAPAPVVIKETIIREVPAKHTAPRARTVHTTYAHNDTYYAPAPRRAPQPNYVGIGTGAGA
jgi:hypothetical protein